MKLMLFVDPLWKSLQGLVGPALVSTVINLGGSCSLSFVSQIAQAVKISAVCAPARLDLGAGVQRERISLRKEQ